MKKLIYIPILFATFLSCKKDDKVCNQDMAGVAGIYMITAVKYKASSSSSEMDYYNQFFTDPCERDDRITLNANGTYVFTDAGVQCSPPGNGTGTWSISGNTIIVDGDASNIESFNCSTLVISNLNVNVPGDKLTLTITRQ